MPSIHAEHDAIRKLSKLNKHKRFISEKEKLDLICIRYSKIGKLGNSRPCRNCLLRMAKCSFNIRNVYYSTFYGDIVMEKFKNMMDSPDTCFTSGCRKKMGISMEEHLKIMRSVKDDDSDNESVSSRSSGGSNGSSKSNKNILKYYNKKIKI